jgi:hypothetical protein
VDKGVVHALLDVLLVTLLFLTGWLDGYRTALILEERLREQDGEAGHRGYPYQK